MTNEAHRLLSEQFSRRMVANNEMAPPIRCAIEAAARQARRVVTAEDRTLIERTHETVSRGGWNYLQGRAERFLYLFNAGRYAQILDEGLVMETVAA